MEHEAIKSIQLIRSGQEYFTLLEKLIHNALHDIQLQTYIFKDDDTGKPVLHALEMAAARGVRVSILVDGYASQDLSQNIINRTVQKGIQFHQFNPVWKSKNFYFGHRLHHKVFVVDQQHALVGGINISNDYNDTVDHLAWLDWALYVEGGIAAQLSKVCDDLLKFEVLSSLRNRFKKKKISRPDGKVQIRMNDWISGKMEITASYMKMLKNATSEVLIMSSYMLPGKFMRKRIRQAAKRGIKIRLIMAGISDVTMAKYAERYMYRWMLRNKIEIYEYQKNVLHAKLAICDQEWLTIGSYNLNNISAYASIELNLDVHDAEFAKHTHKRLEEIIKNDCKAITMIDLHKYNWFEQFLQRSAYDIFRVVLFLFTFYFKQRE